ncbi:ATP-binding protein [Salinisphaera sp. T31B1]|uniref:ATP-binding protein n=1 Tax=Salinisphaera sp. T31B1 TaxID=727963 RepID=UPI00333E72AA
MLNHAFTLNATQVLGLLARLRLVVALAYAAALAVAALVGQALAPWVWAVPAALLVFNARVSADRGTATAGRIARHLGFDTLALFIVLWASGGATNPFVSLFLVPVAIAGVTLPPRPAAGLTTAAIAAYTLLLLRYLRSGHGSSAMGGFETHVIGMWLNFVLAAILLCVFLLAVTAALRVRERELAAQRERLLRDDAIVSVATLAAGAAHALNTPLGTIALAAESLEAHPDLPDDARAEVDTINAQAQVCAAQLRQLVDAHRPDPDAQASVAGFATGVIERWRARRPEIDSAVTGLDRLPAAPLRNDPALAQAFQNLLDNAADASLAADCARVAIDWGCEPGEDDGPATLRLSIDDNGRDGDPGFIDGVGLTSTKPGGLGLGVTLARASIVRLGGRLSWHSRPGGGMRTEVRLPMAALANDLRVLSS